MSPRSERFQELWQSFYRPSTVESLGANFALIEAAVASAELTSAEGLDLKATAFRAMIDATANDATNARAFILDQLIPHCLDSMEDGSSDERFSRHRFRECLRDWLERLPEPGRTSIRADVLSVLCERLSGQHTDAVCWAIGYVGFRSPQVVDALWDVAQRSDDQSADIALATLTALGVPPQSRGDLVSAVNRRVPKRLNLFLITALRRLADPVCLDSLEKHWLPSLGNESRRPLASLVLQILGDVAAACDDRKDVQDRVWDLLMAVHRAAPALVDGSLYVGGALASEIDSERVIPDLLRELIVDSNEASNQTVRRSQLYHRLETCVRPNQLAAWRCSIEPRWHGIVLMDALIDTKSVGPYATIESRLKRAAWDVLLCAGDAAVPTADVFDRAIVGESSPNVRHSMFEIISCFRLDPLPQQAVFWVTERRDIDRAEMKNELLDRSGATAVLRGAATRDAFESLLSFGFTISGAVLWDSADALVDVALTLAYEGDRSIGRDLVETALQAPQRNNRVAALQALLHYVAQGHIVPPECAGLAAALDEAERDEYERMRTIEALGVLPRELFTSDVEAKLVKWAWHTNRLGQSCLEALARHDRLIAYPDLLTERVGLRLSGEKWALDLGRSGTESNGLVFGLLYEKHPESLVDAVAGFLVAHEWSETAPLVLLLDDLFVRARAVRPPQSIIEALIVSTRKSQTRISGNTELVSFLARWDFGALVNEAWEKWWADWLPDARAALATALGSAMTVDQVATRKALALLLGLVNDGQYAVRRAAYRSIARLSERTLVEICAITATTDDGLGPAMPTIEMRRRGAEACAWLPLGPVFAEAFEPFVSDSEWTVRETAKRVQRERRDRLDAEHCLDAVLGVRTGSNDEMLSAWCFGRALAQIGDDDCIARIRRHESEDPLPPNVRTWLRRLKESIERNWRSVTEKWPEPWLHLEGSIEEGDGFLEDASGVQTAVRYAVWNKPAVRDQKGAWGGAAWFHASFFPWHAVLPETFLVMMDGRRGSIICFQKTQDRIMFAGTGPPPA